jgi:Ca2+-binding EF-hand superfamily protein
MVKTKAVDWADMARRLPTNKNDPAQKKMRAEYWRGFDNNGNGYISLAETEKGIRDVIKLDSMFDAKPAIIRAFNFAKDALPGKISYGADYIEKKEFRIFLVALRQRFEYFQAFKRIDSGGDGRIDVQEFIAAKDIVEKWVGKMEDPYREF